MQSSPYARKRFLIAVPLGIFFGFVCAALASGSAPAGFWGGPIMWSIVADRFLIGLLIAMAGVFTVHPVFSIPCPWYFRGAIMGLLGSLPLAAGAMSTPNPAMTPWNLFFLTVAAGIFYGISIDLVATKWGGEGKKLLG
jgi:hypothetical protein